MDVGLPRLSEVDGTQVWGNNSVRNSIKCSMAYNDSVKLLCTRAQGESSCLLVGVKRILGIAPQKRPSDIVTESPDSV